MIATNKGNLRIMIVTHWTETPNGQPANIDGTISLQPGEKIDLSMLGIEIEREAAVEEVVKALDNLIFPKAMHCITPENLKPVNRWQEGREALENYWKSK